MSGVEKAAAVRAVRVWPTMITPLTEDDRIDFDGVQAILDWYAAKGVRGVFAVCKSSEIFEMSFAERLELTRFVLRHAPKGMLVAVSGHVADDEAAQIEEAKRLADLGPDVFVMISNRFEPVRGAGGWARRAERFMDALPSDQLLGMYECPHPYLRALTPEELGGCAQRDNVVFLKDCCCDLDLIAAKLAAVAGRPLSLYNANSATLLASLRMGAAGYASVMANFHPDLYESLCADFEAHPDRAEALQRRLTALSLLENQNYPQNAKYHMTLEGVPIGTRSRIGPGRPLTASQREEVRQLHRLSRDLAGTL